MKLKLKAFYVKCYLRTLPIIILSIVALLMLFSLFNEVSWLYLIIKGLVVVVVYLILVLLFATTKTEKKYIISKFRKEKKENDE